MLRIPYQELIDTLTHLLVKLGFEHKRARLCARLFTDTTRDGVYSHGLNRCPRFIQDIRNGNIDIHAQPKAVATHGALERWNGMRGPGNLNAYQCMARAISIAEQHGVACVALANTNHWNRGGSYGWQAAEAGFIGVCWTNTGPILPAWGASDSRLGNNPLVIAVPRPKGHVVLDMAMSQFSYGALATYRMRGNPLPVDGGFDSDGQVTRNPAAIEASKRPLPIGFWKGSGLALVLDMMASALSGGQSTYQIPRGQEAGVSQVFLAFDLSRFGPAENFASTADQIIEFLQSSQPVEGGDRVRYSGEQTLKTRAENLLLGVPVEPDIWHKILAMC